MTAELIARTAQRFAAARPSEAALVLDRLASAPVAEVIAELEPAVAARTLESMGPDRASRVLGELDDATAREIMLACDPVRVAGLLALMPDEARARLLATLPERVAREIVALFEFPPGTAGRLMDARVVPFREETPAGEVIDRLRALGDRRILDVLTTDASGRLTGIVPLQALLSAPDATPVGSLAPEEPQGVHAMAPRDTVVEMLSRHGLTTLPVLDLDRRIIGVLRYDALVRAAQVAATDDLQQMVGAGREERGLSHPMLSVKSRLPWLLINLLTACTAASVVGLFDDTIARYTALAVLLPIVAGQSGNAGAQALAVTMRGLALREIRLTHSARVLRKELLAALVNGLSSGSATALAVWLWSGSHGLAFAIGASMLISMVLAALAGATVPLVLTAFGRDPATASSIILTSVTDITGFFSFLGLATLIAEHVGL